jgi:hypothetical protein
MHGSLFGRLGGQAKILVDAVKQWLRQFRVPIEEIVVMHHHLIAELFCLLFSIR